MDVFEDDERLISKKELLKKYSISYGALYRWKRKGLIPEEWFIKRSTVTGQETYFPRDLVCERMELIKSAKDEIALDDLAKKLSGSEEKTAAMVMSTVFGDKKFYLSDITRVTLTRGDGTIVDITEKITNLFKGE